jgi:hypothetical protein
MPLGRKIRFHEIRSAIDMSVQVPQDATRFLPKKRASYQRIQARFLEQKGTAVLCRQSHPSRCQLDELHQWVHQ